MFYRTSFTSALRSGLIFHFHCFSFKSDNVITVPYSILSLLNKRSHPHPPRRVFRPDVVDVQWTELWRKNIFDTKWTVFENSCIHFPFKLRPPENVCILCGSLCKMSLYFKNLCVHEGNLLGILFQWFWLEVQYRKVSQILFVISCVGTMDSYNAIMTCFVLFGFVWFFVLFFVFPH